MGPPVGADQRPSGLEGSQQGVGVPADPEEGRIAKEDVVLVVAPQPIEDPEVCTMTNRSDGLTRS